MIPDYITKKIDPKQVIKNKQVRAKRKALLEVRKELGVTHEEVRRLFDCKNTWDYPNTPVKEDRGTHDNKPSKDPILQLANIVYDYWHDEQARESWDNENAVVDVYKNFGSRYNNAFWDGEGLVFGNGDQVYFKTFLTLDVMAHEFGHAVTDTSSKLIYYGQSGALNEHFSDVTGIAIKHYINDQEGESKNWIIGEGLFTDRVSGVGLRSMDNPGSAYNDDVLGQDPQPGNMSDYVETDDDEGGVHINSGIPNKAFFNFCQYIGANSYNIPFNIWYNTLLRCSPNTDFNEFVEIMVNFVANDPDLKQYRNKLVQAWKDVGLAEDINIEDPDPGPGPDKPHKCFATRQIKKIKRIVNRSK